MTQQLESLAPSPSVTSDHSDFFRVVIFRGAGSEVFMQVRNDRFFLPSIPVAQDQRVAETANMQVWNEFRIPAYSLFAVHSVESSSYLVMESRNSGGGSSRKVRWIRTASLNEQDFLKPDDRSIVLAAFRDIRSPLANHTVGPFGRIGWIEELLDWAQDEVTHLGLRLTRNFCQFNASSNFALVRLETDGPSLWFKAVGEPNLREFSITSTLARLFPTFLPTLIAAHPSWHGWLALDIQGATLEATSDASAWECAAGTLSVLQIASLEMTQELCHAGCKDLTIGSLQKQLGPFMEIMTELMEKQEKISPPALGIEELLTLREQVDEALSELANLRLPNVLGHLDISPANILCSPEGCLFVDWAEAYIGPPFLVLEHLEEHFLRTPLGEGTSRIGLRSRYADEWRRLLSSESIAEAQRLAPLVAVLAYSIGIQQWRNPELLRVPRLAAYFRSLTRRMHREAQVLKTKSS